MIETSALASNTYIFGKSDQNSKIKNVSKSLINFFCFSVGSKVSGTFIYALDIYKVTRKKLKNVLFVLLISIIYEEFLLVKQQKISDEYT